eukprot:TRINITY_DN3055_c0_g1_i1.p1 TRINITY_DN3055_c0_g1~~TRINITY_DN3055_c0_g1_i1.p1  ORF type:complete len:265 (+),score=42.24 TRINITY_DN3055_c0_g1_i1:67-861(+)
MHLRRAAVVAHRRCVLRGVFGGVGGSAITNKASILANVDKCCRPTDPAPPAVEYLLVEAAGRNPFGHAAVCYTHPDTQERIVMNVVNNNHDATKEAALINFLPLDEYLFGVDPVMAPRGEQGGVYQRNVCGVRVERLPRADVLAMHHLFQSFAFQEAAGRAAFTAGGNMHPILQHFTPGLYVARGNCARWSARGLVAAGLIRTPSMFPKLLWIHLFQSMLTRDASNVSVVYYQRRIFRHPSCVIPRIPDPHCQRIFVSIAASSL